MLFALSSQTLSTLALARPRSIRDSETAVSRYCQIGSLNSAWFRERATTLGSKLTPAKARSNVCLEMPFTCAKGQRSATNFENAGSVLVKVGRGFAVAGASERALNRENEAAITKPRRFWVTGKKISARIMGALSAPWNRVRPIHSGGVISSGRGIEMTLYPESTKCTSPVTPEDSPESR